MAMNSTKTPIAFKKGSQNTFNNLSSFTEGTLYLTDAGHLYYANGTTKDSVIQISNIHKITSYGDFSGKEAGQNYLNSIESTAIIGDYYYLVPDNALMYKKNTGWSQINPDTALTASSTIVSISSEAGTNKATISTSISDTSHNVASGAFTLTGGRNIDLAIDPKDNHNIIINNNLENSNTTYELKSASATTGAYLNLIGSDDTATPQQVLIKGDNGITVTANGATGITISGHPMVSRIDNIFNAQGEFNTRISYNASTSLTSAAITPIIGYRGTTAAAYSATAVFVNGVANLNIYSATAVDELIEEAKRSLDAMTYKGTIATTAAIAGLASSTANQCGDTYRVVSDINTTVDGQPFNVKIGDLIIFNGADNTSATFETLEIVPSGNETQLKVTGTAGDNRIAFQDSLAGTVGAAQLGSIQFTNTRSTTKNALINIATSESSSGNFVINLTHGAAGIGTTVTPAAVDTNSTQQSEGSLVIPGVSKLIKDDNGHIVDIELQNYQVNDTHPTISAATPSGSNTTGTASITFGYKLNHTSGTVDQAYETIKITSSTLIVNASVSANAGVYTIDLEWGNF